jgi:hypothetical protein
MSLIENCLAPKKSFHLSETKWVLDNIRSSSSELKSLPLLLNGDLILAEITCVGILDMAIQATELYEFQLSRNAKQRIATYRRAQESRSK